MLRRIKSSSSYLKDRVTETFIIKSYPDCRYCQEFYVCKQHRAFNLVSHENVPEHMQPNPYITSGFRPNQLTWDLCIKR